jgi:ABC-type sulfate/molybdate transport systems ATPase subunit
MFKNFCNLKVAVRQGKLIALASIVGSGKTTTLRKTRALSLVKEK